MRRSIAEIKQETEQETIKNQNAKLTFTLRNLAEYLRKTCQEAEARNEDFRMLRGALVGLKMLAAEMELPVLAEIEETLNSLYQEAE